MAKIALFMIVLILAIGIIYCVTDGFEEIDMIQFKIGHLSSTPVPSPIPTPTPSPTPIILTIPPTPMPTMTSIPIPIKKLPHYTPKPTPQSINIPHRDDDFYKRLQEWAENESKHSKQTPFPIPYIPPMPTPMREPQ